jgi:hypothetical protein
MDVFTQLTNRTVVAGGSYPEDLIVSTHFSDVRVNVLSYPTLTPPGSQTPIDLQPFPAVRYLLTVPHTSNQSRYTVRLQATRDSVTQTLSFFVDKVPPQVTLTTNAGDVLVDGSSSRSLRVRLSDQDCDGSCSMFIQNRSTGVFEAIPAGPSDLNWKNTTSPTGHYYQFPSATSGAVRFFVRDQSMLQTPTYRVILDSTAPLFEVRGERSNRLYALQDLVVTVNGVVANEPVVVRPLEPNLRIRVARGSGASYPSAFASTTLYTPIASTGRIIGSGQDADGCYLFQVEDAAGNSAQLVNQVSYSTCRVQIDTTMPAAELQEVRALASSPRSVVVLPNQPNGVTVYRGSSVRIVREPGTSIAQVWKNGIVIASASVNPSSLVTLNSGTTADMATGGEYAVQLTDLAGNSAMFTFTINDSLSGLFTARRASDQLTPAALTSGSAVTEAVVVQWNGDYDGTRPVYLNTSTSPMAFDSTTNSVTISEDGEYSIRSGPASSPSSDVLFTFTIDTAPPAVVVEYVSNASAQQWTPIAPSSTAGLSSAPWFETGERIRIRLSDTVVSSAHSVYVSINGSGRLTLSPTAPITLTNDGNYILSFTTLLQTTASLAYKIRKSSILTVVQLVDGSSSSPQPIVLSGSSSITTIGQHGFRIGKRLPTSTADASVSVRYAYTFLPLPTQSNPSPSPVLVDTSFSTATSPLFVAPGDYLQVRASTSTSAVFTFGDVRIPDATPVLVLESIVSATNAYPVKLNATSPFRLASEQVATAPADSLLAQLVAPRVRTADLLQRWDYASGAWTDVSTGNTWALSPLSAPALEPTPYAFRAVRKNPSTQAVVAESDFAVGFFLVPAVEWKTSSNQSVVQGGYYRLPASSGTTISGQTQVDPHFPSSSRGVRYVSSGVTLSTVYESSGLYRTIVSSSVTTAEGSVVATLYSASGVVDDTEQQPTPLPLQTIQYTIDNTAPVPSYQVWNSELGLPSGGVQLPSDSTVLRVSTSSPASNVVRLICPPESNGSRLQLSVRDDATGELLYSSGGQPLLSAINLALRYVSSPSPAINIVALIATQRSNAPLAFSPAGPLASLPFSASRVYSVRVSDEAGNEVSGKIQFAHDAAEHFALSYIRQNDETQTVFHVTDVSLLVDNGQAIVPHYHGVTVRFLDTARIQSIAIHRDGVLNLRAPQDTSDFVPTENGKYTVTIVDSASGESASYAFRIDRTISVSLQLGEQQSTLMDPFASTQQSQSQPLYRALTSTASTVYLSTSELKSLGAAVDVRVSRGGSVVDTVSLTNESAPYAVNQSPSGANETVLIELRQAHVPTAGYPYSIDVLFDTRVDVKLFVANAPTETECLGSGGGPSSNYLDLVAYEPLASVTINGAAASALQQSDKYSNRPYYAIRGDGSKSIVARDVLGNEYNNTVVLESTVALYGIFGQTSLNQYAGTALMAQSSLVPGVFQVSSREPLSLTSTEEAPNGRVAYYTLSFHTFEYAPTQATQAIVRTLLRAGDAVAISATECVVRVYLDNDPLTPPHRTYVCRVRDAIVASVFGIGGSVSTELAPKSSVQRYYRCVAPVCDIHVEDPQLFESESAASSSSLSAAIGVDVVDERTGSTMVPAPGIVRFVPLRGKVMAVRRYRLEQDGVYTFSITDDLLNVVTLQIVVCSEIALQFQLLGAIGSPKVGYAVPSSSSSSSSAPLLLPDLKSFADLFAETDSDSMSNFVAPASVIVRRPLSIAAPDVSTSNVVYEYKLGTSVSAVADNSAQQPWVAFSPSVVSALEFRMEHQGQAPQPYCLAIRKTMRHGAFPAATDAVQKFICLAFTLDTTVRMEIVSSSSTSTATLLSADDVCISPDMTLALGEPLTLLRVNGATVSTGSVPEPTFTNNSAAPPTLLAPSPFAVDNYYVVFAQNQFDQLATRTATRLTQLPVALRWNGQDIPSSESSADYVYKTLGAIFPLSNAVAAAKIQLIQTRPSLTAPSLFDIKVQFTSTAATTTPSSSVPSSEVTTVYNPTSFATTFDQEGAYEATIEFSRSNTRIKGSRSGSNASQLMYTRRFTVDNSPTIFFHGADETELHVTIVNPTTKVYNLGSAQVSFVSASEVVSMDVLREASGGEVERVHPVMTLLPTQTLVPFPSLPAAEAGTTVWYEIHVTDMMFNYALYRLAIVGATVPPTIT